MIGAIDSHLVWLLGSALFLGKNKQFFIIFFGVILESLKIFLAGHFFKIFSLEKIIILDHLSFDTPAMAKACIPNLLELKIFENPPSQLQQLNVNWIKPKVQLDWVLIKSYI